MDEWQCGWFWLGWRLTNWKAASVVVGQDREWASGWLVFLNGGGWWATKQSARQVAQQKTVIQFAIENRRPNATQWGKAQIELESDFRYDSFIAILINSTIIISLPCHCKCKYSFDLCHRSPSLSLCFYWRSLSFPYIYLREFNNPIHWRMFNWILSILIIASLSVILRLLSWKNIKSEY